MTVVASEIIASVWKIEVGVGDAVSAGDTLIILESMKMEIRVEAPSAGTVIEILCAEGQAVAEGDSQIVLE